MDRIHPEVISWVRKNGGGEIRTSAPVGGGCIHQARILETETGARFFLKHNRAAPPDMFIREAEGLEALRESPGPAVPDVFLVGDSYLLLEDLQPAPRCENFWRIYGRQLAGVHSLRGPGFGFAHDNYLGANPQPNGWLDDGYVFYRERRFLPQISWARDRSLLEPRDISGLERLIQNLPQLIPQQPACLIHGDLWSGNLVTNNAGQPALVDPAAYYGWVEADLAMANLFGSYPEEFYLAYQEICRLESGYRSRFAIYNLYHLLNHLNLFGRSYLAQIRTVIARFG